ncbi:hypothetical protein EZV62_019443 [Acer yangbiense]|uniref:Receptor ligand binding region domain-containing protein n=1 Tax=Acer yangbiense TaxID=1000413 RepID=A0A5C7HB97_9ROSI|nr:hypothetical protein EZV62_019443 [Acer yangbiense]
MCGDLCLLLLLLLLVVGSKGKAKDIEWHIGGVIDYSSRVGKEQMIAMEMAVQDFQYRSTACCKLQMVLHFKDSRGNLARAASVALELMHKKQVQAIIGTLPVAEAALISMIDETTTNNIPIISLTSPGILPAQQLPSILQMSNDITLHTRCIAAILAILIFDKAKQMGMMEKGYVWTVSEEIANLLHSLDSSVFDNMQGLSGKIGFKNGKLAENSTFQIINVVVPKGWSSSNEEQPLKIGVPANGAINQFVRVSYDLRRNGTYVSGFSVKVFEAVVNRLPYHLPYVLVPFYGSYDDMVEQIFYKGLGAAVGDTEIMADRYQYAEFSQPYVESGLVMALHENLYNKNVAANGGNALVRRICHLVN